MRSILSIILMRKYTCVEGLEPSRSNPSPYLTEAILSIPIDTPDLYCNSNPGLTNYLISVVRVLKNTKNYWDNISGNNNPGLTNHLIKNEKSICWDAMSTNNNILLTDFILFNFDKVNISRFVSNSNPNFTSIIEEIINHKWYPNVCLNTNPLLARLLIDNEDKLDFNAIASNPNPGLTGFIIRCEDIITDKQRLMSNNNVELTGLLLSLRSNYSFDSKNNNPFIVKYGINGNICGNNSPLLTNKILELKIVDEDLFLNTNPELAGFILDNIKRSVMPELSSNPNPRLTKFLIENEDKIDFDELSKNTNKKLEHLIIKNKAKVNVEHIDNNRGFNSAKWLEFVFELKRQKNYISPVKKKLKFWTYISKNNSPSKTQFIINNEKRLDLDALSENNNPELTDLIIKLESKINYKILSRNTNKKLLPLMMKNHHKLDLDALRCNPIIAVVDKERSKFMLDNFD